MKSATRKASVVEDKLNLHHVVLVPIKWPKDPVTISKKFPMEKSSMLKLQTETKHHETAWLLNNRHSIPHSPIWKCECKHKHKDMHTISQWSTSHNNHNQLTCLAHTPSVSALCGVAVTLNDAAAILFKNTNTRPSGVASLVSAYKTTYKPIRQM